MKKPRKPAAEQMAEDAIADPELKRTAEELAREVIVETDRGLKAVFPGPPGKVSRGPIGLSHLEQFEPATRRTLAIGYALAGLSIPSADSRFVVANNIGHGFSKFIGSLDAPPRLKEIDERMLLRFKAWQDERTSPGYVRSQMTRRDRILAIQAVLKALMRSAEYRDLLSPDLAFMENPYPNARDGIVPVETLKDGQLDDVFDAAACACEEIMDRIGPSLDEIERLSRPGTPIDLATAGTSPEACAVYFTQVTGGAIGTYKSRIHGKAVVRDAIPQETFEAAARILHLTVDDLVPFAIILALAFGLNTGVVLNMLVTDFEVKKVLGKERIRIFPNKPRSRKVQRHELTITDDPVDPGRILPFLKRWTALIRKSVRQPAHEKQLFIRYSGHFTVIPVLYADRPFNEALDRFCVRFELDPFRLRQLRPTILDKVHDLTGGDLSLTQATAHHQSSRTTERHYLGSGARRRNEERLARAMSRRHRDIRTSGRVSPIGLPKEADPGAATPGFKCTEPYDSPWDDQSKDVLCEAYGRCGSCELALVDYSSPTSYAYLQQLRERMDEARETLGPVVWITRWSPFLKDLLVDHLLEFEKRPEVVAAGRRAIVSKLPPLE